MPSEIIRSATRSDALDRYAEALRSKQEKGESGIRFAEFNATAAANDSDAANLPLVSTNQIRLNDLVDRRDDPMGTDPELAKRAANRRILAGLTTEPEKAQTTEELEPQPELFSQSQIVDNVEGLMTSASTNQLTRSIIANLITSLDINEGRKKWLVKQAQSGIVDPDIFMRDLRLSVR